MSSYNALPFGEPGDVESQQQEYQKQLERREHAYRQPGLQLAVSIQEPPKKHFPGIDPNNLERMLRVLPKQEKPAIH